MYLNILPLSIVLVAIVKCRNSFFKLHSKRTPFLFLFSRGFFLGGGRGEFKVGENLTASRSLGLLIYPVNIYTSFSFLGSLLMLWELWRKD